MCKNVLLFEGIAKNGVVNIKVEMAKTQKLYISDSTYEMKESVIFILTLVSTLASLECEP